MPRCPAHPAEEILGACERCGDFVCPLDARTVEARRVCLRCAPLVTEDHLERYRKELWGRADGYWYLFGVLAPVLTAIFMWRAPPLEAAFGVGGLAVFGAYALRQPWARVALFLCPLAGAGLAVPHGGRAIIAGVLAAAMGGLVVLAAFFSTTNRLAFRMEVDRKELQRLWDVRRNNPRARESVGVAVVALLLWPLLPVALILGVLGLRAVDPDADPPVGRRWEAITGIVISLAGIAAWGAAWVSRWL